MHTNVLTCFNAVRGCSVHGFIVCVRGYVRVYVRGGRSRYLGLGLSSRRNLCIHEEISRERNGKVVDARCRELTASYVRSRNEGKALCDFFNGFQKDGKEQPIPAGIYNLVGVCACVLLADCV